MVALTSCNKKHRLYGRSRDLWNLPCLLRNRSLESEIMFPARAEHVLIQFAKGPSGVQPTVDEAEISEP